MYKQQTQKKKKKKTDANIVTATSSPANILIFDVRSFYFIIFNLYLSHF